MRGTLPPAALALCASLVVSGFPGPVPAAAQDTHVLVVVGLGGEPRFRERFHEWATTFLDAARERFAVPEERVIYLGERVEVDPGRIRARSTRENVEEAFAELARASVPGDHVLVLLVGHGTESRGEARFNLPGPDLGALEYAALLDGLPDRRISFVNAASASGGFVEALAAEGRVVITATRGPGERNATVFGGHFVEAFTTDEADLDRDGTVSVLEAFVWAREGVAEFYRREGRIRTETALMDDTGSGVGSTEVDPAAVEGVGTLARTRFVGRPATGAGAMADRDPLPGSPELRRLIEERRAIELRLDTLRGRRASMPEAEYEAALEALLVELALKDREIRAARGGGG